MPEIVVVCEHRDDWELVALLADRVLREKGPAWLAEIPLESFRRWCGLPIADTRIQFITWAQLKAHPKPAKSLGYKKLGWDAEACRKAIIATASQSREHQVVALLLSRDLDSEPTRRKVLEAVRTESKPAFQILLATPNPEIEAWIFHGFEPLDREEERRLAELCRRLAFDPRREAHRFTGRKSGQDLESRDIKRALNHLTGADRDRQLAGLDKAPLDVLSERGQKTHLADYLREIEERLLPALTGQPPAAGKSSPDKSGKAP